MNTRVEKAIFFALLVIATVGMTQFLAVRFFTGHADSASMVDLIRNIATGQGLRSSFNSGNDIWPLLTANADAYCRLTFIPRFRDASVLIWHPYWVAYPMAALTALPGVNALTVVTFLTALSHIGVLGLLWWFLRRQNVPMAVAAMFVLAVFVFKPVSESLLGQLYFDRLFLLPGTALVLLVHLHFTEKARSLWLIAALAFFCVLLSDRPCIMVGVFLLGYPLLRQGRKVVRSSDSIVLMAMGLACLIYAFLYFWFVQHNPEYTSLTIPGAFEWLKTSLAPDGALRPQSMKLFAVLTPFILLGLFDWRLGLIAVGSVVPNLMVSVGGAEKNLFLTHYHMPYLPFVLAAAAVGLVRLWRLARDRAGAAQPARMLPTTDAIKAMLAAAEAVGLPRLWRLARDRAGGAQPARMLMATAALTAMLAMVAAYSNWFNEADLTHTFVFNHPMDPILPPALVPGLTDRRHSYDFVFRDFSRDLVSTIPRGSAVSAPEGLWPALVDRKILTIDFMPFGIGPDPYVVLVYAPNPISGPELQLPVVPDAKVRACVQSRVDQSYREIRQAEFGSLRYVIYQHQ